MKTKYILTTLGLSFTFLVAFPLAAKASLVGITDSGTDFEHVELANRAWVNKGEIAGNRIDDDRNGKVDDINGWNFAEAYNRIFYREHLSEINPIAPRLIEVIAHKQAHEESAEDKKFWDDNITHLTAEEKEALVAHLNYYGEYVHGTHVAGIIASQAPDAKLLISRIFPDDLAPEYDKPMKIHTTGFVDLIYRLLAVVSNGIFDQVGLYLNEQHVDVANYSVGIPLKTLAEKSLAIQGNDHPTAVQLAAETQRLYTPFAEAGKKWMASSPGTLFVVAAGNDNSDNDMYPTFPANIRMDNEITVAATQDWWGLADFSCFGKTTVDLAAPGVAVISTVPSEDKKAHLPLSGTSMAAPFVTGVAAHIKDINPALTPLKIRTLLMGTVDVKPWLQGKVVSSGVVNPDRAYAAAEFSKTMDLTAAMTQAKATVADHVVHGPTQQPALHADASMQELSDWAATLVF